MVRNEMGALLEDTPVHGRIVPQRGLEELRQALREEQFRLYFQPLWSRASRRVTGFEALLRWQHPERGLLTPGSFIELAEREEVHQSVTDWVIDAGLMNLRRWHRAGYDLSLAINISPRDLAHADADMFWTLALADRDLSPHNLTLEVTEREALLDSPDVTRVLSDLRRQGMDVAIDDYGTGCSANHLLCGQSFTQIKVDRSFAGRVAVDQYARLVTANAVGLAHELGLEVVAEGVEDDAAWDILESMGCDYVQGYALARPMPADEVTRWYENWPGHRSV